MPCGLADLSLTLERMMIITISITVISTINFTMSILTGNFSILISICSIILAGLTVEG